VREIATSLRHGETRGVKKRALRAVFTHIFSLPRQNNQKKRSFQ